MVYIHLHEWLIFMVNVGEYTIHGSYGYGRMKCFWHEGNHIGSLIFLG